MPNESKPPAGFGSTFNQYLWQRMNTADAKIGVIAAANLAFVALFLSNTPSAPPNVSPILWTIYGLAIAFFAASASVSFFGFFPQWKHETDQGVIFWRSILSEDGAAKYQDELRKDLGDPQAVEDAYAAENYRVCNNFATKNKLIQISIVLFVLGSLLALISLGIRDVGMVTGTH